MWDTRELRDEQKDENTHEWHIKLAGARRASPEKFQGHKNRTAVGAGLSNYPLRQVVYGTQEPMHSLLSTAACPQQVEYKLTMV